MPQRIGNGRQAYIFEMTGITTIDLTHGVKVVLYATGLAPSSIVNALHVMTPTWVMAEYIRLYGVEQEKYKSVVESSLSRDPAWYQLRVYDPYVYIGGEPSKTKSIVLGSNAEDLANRFGGFLMGHTKLPFNDRPENLEAIANGLIKARVLKPLSFYNIQFQCDPTLCDIWPKMGYIIDTSVEAASRINQVITSNFAEVYNATS